MNTLRQRRDDVYRQRSQFEDTSALAHSHVISNDILHSWERSAKAVQGRPKLAPRDDECTVSAMWEESQLSMAAQHEQSYIQQLVNEGQLIAAIADPYGQLLWTCASGYMGKRADKLNFAVGGYWGEHDVGTNAVGLSLRLKRPVTVFSSEHYSPFVQDWVCYAAPIIHPVSKECIGVLDISTTWNKHTPLGQSATAQLAHAIAQHLPATQRADLEIYAMGQPKIIYQGQLLCLPPRQIEILCLLALNPDGISLKKLHSILHGDSSVSTATVKADVSHLRACLNGNIGSQPYRLTIPVWADFLHIWNVLNKGKISEATSIYRGPLLENSEVSEIEEWRHCIDAIMTEKINSCDSADQLIQKISYKACGSVLERERLVELLSN